jgi:hypothetical protein
VCKKPLIADSTLVLSLSPFLFYATRLAGVLGILGAAIRLYFSYGGGSLL